MKKIWSKLLSFSKVHYFLTFAVIVLVVFLIRSCANNIILHQRIYYIAQSNNWSPLELYGHEADMSAFISELLTRISEDEKLQLHSSVVGSTDMFAVLQSGQYDAILATFTTNSFLKEQYFISDPIYMAGPVLIVTEDSKIASTKELEGKAVGIRRGSSWNFKLSQDSALLLIPYDNMIIALDDLEKNILGGVIMEAELAYVYTKGFYKGILKVATAPLTDLALRLVTKKKKGEEDLILHFNAGLKKLEENGSYEQLITRWSLNSI